LTIEIIPIEKLPLITKGDDLAKLICGAANHSRSRFES